MDCDWDIEKYRNKFEPEEQWELRRKFMETYKHLPEDRVVCLAQVLVNIEFLGTKYPSETMRTVAEMSKEIIEEFRDRQKMRLQRTFVGAAEAASAKVNKVFQPLLIPKCEKTKKFKEKATRTMVVAAVNISKTTEIKRKMDQSSVSTVSQETENLEVPSKKRKRKKKNKSKEIKQVDDHIEPSDCTKTFDSSASVSGHGHRLQSKPSTKKDDRPITVDAGLSNFVIIIMMTQKEENSPTVNYRQIIENSARYSNIGFDVTTNFLPDQSTWECVLRLNDKDFTSSQHHVQKTCLRNLYTNAFAILIRTQYQIILKDQMFVSVAHFLTYVEDIRQTQSGRKLSTTITKEAMGRKQNSSSSNSSSSAAQIILSKGESAMAPPVKSTVAEKMMKMMGWTEGTGLGMQKQGIVEPIKSDVIVGREGIGFDGTGDEKSFLNLIRRYLQNYMNSYSVHNVVFSSEFSNEQRKKIHDVARKMGMVSKSFGKEPNRQITVRRSPCTFRPLVELLNQLIESNGSDPLFEKVCLIPPTK